MKPTLLVVLGLGVAALAAASGAQTEPALPASGNVPLYSFRYRDAPLDAVLENLKSMTGKNVVVAGGLTATVTASASDKLTAEEALAFIAQVLNAQGIVLENLDENTIRVRGAPDGIVDPGNAGSNAPGIAPAP